MSSFQTTKESGIVESAGELEAGTELDASRDGMTFSFGENFLSAKREFSPVHLEELAKVCRTENKATPIARIPHSESAQQSRSTDRDGPQSNCSSP